MSKQPLTKEEQYRRQLGGTNAALRREQQKVKDLEKENLKYKSVIKQILANSDPYICAFINQTLISEGLIDSKYTSNMFKTFFENYENSY